MKKSRFHTVILRHLQYLFLLPILLCSCLHEYPETTADGTQGVDPTQVNITADIVIDRSLLILNTPKPLTRATEEDALQRRFIIDAYQGNERVARQVIYEDIEEGNDSGKSITPISLRLHASKYTLAIWTDYVPADTHTDLYYNTTDFRSITCTEPYRACTDRRDALYGTTELDLTPYRNQWNVKVPLDIDMQRPLARYELIAKDVEAFRKKDSGAPYTVNIRYGYYLPVGFNVLTGKPGYSLTGVSYAQELKLPVAGKECSIGFDYLFVNNESSFVSLTIEVVNNKGKVVARSGSVEVPYKRNHQTTLRGAFLTASPGGVDIETDFEGDIDIDLGEL